MTRIAIRNLFRNRWRSILTAGGVAAATAMLVWTIAMMEGMMAQMIRSATAVETAQVVVSSAQYPRNPTIFNHMPEDQELLQQIRALPRVMAATPRCYTYGLVGHETQSQVARITAIDSLNELAATPLGDAIVEGRWLNQEPAPDLWTPREALLGYTFAEQLGAEVGDNLVLFTQAADGALANAEIVVVGILRSGNLMLDRQSVYLHLADLQTDLALEGLIHEIIIRIDRLDLAPQVAMQVDNLLQQRPNHETPVIARSWQEISPEMAAMIELSTRGTWVSVFIVYLVVALGILNAQRMSALERRREFGVLLAIGLSPFKISRMIIAETVILTLAGAVAGAALGYLVSLYHQLYGLDLALFSDHARFDYMGISFTGRLHFVISSDAIFMPLTAVSIVALLCGLWPAIKSARLNITQAIAGRA